MPIPTSTTDAEVALRKARSNVSCPGTAGGG
jgi:hypothetical protein